MAQLPLTRPVQRREDTETGEGTGHAPWHNGAHPIYSVLPANTKRLVCTHNNHNPNPAQVRAPPTALTLSMLAIWVDRLRRASDR